MLFRFKPFETSTVYRFKDPDTKFIFEAVSFESLCTHIREYRKQNELEELEFLPVIVENYLCSQPENVGKCKPMPKLKRGIFQYLKGGIALLKNVAYNLYVSQAEADRRSRICASCPLNVFPDRGPFVVWSDNLAIETVGNRKSSHHDELGNCEACGCPLRAKVFYGGKIELKKEEIDKMPDICWQKRAVLDKKG